MNASLTSFVVLVSLLLLGADCQKTEQACIDFSGYELEVTVTNPEICFERSHCEGVEIPSVVRLRVLDEPADRLDRSCRVPRAEVVGERWGNLVLEEPAVARSALWVQANSRFAIANRARIDGTECTGFFFANYGTLPHDSPANRSERWLSTDEPAIWRFDYVFVHDADSPCLPLDGIEECGSSGCTASTHEAD